MEYRQLGNSGFKVPVLSLGTATFGGEGEFFKAWGQTDVAEAMRMIDLCLDNDIIRHRRRLLLRCFRKHSRPGNQGPSRQGLDLYQSHL